MGRGESGVQDRAAGETGENALDFDKLPGTQHSVPGADRETAVEHRRVVQLGHVTLVDVAQSVYDLAVPGLGGDDLDAVDPLLEEPAGAHQRAGGAQAGHEV